MADRLDLTFAAGKVIVTLATGRLDAGIATNEMVFAVSTSASWLGNEGPDNSPMLLAGRLWANNKGMRHIGNVAHQLLTLRGYRVDYDLRIPVTTEQVLALDAERDGGDLMLRLDLQGVLLAAPAAIYPVSEAQTSLRIPAPNWLQALDRLGTELSLLVRVPTPLVDVGGAPPPTAGPADPAAASRGQAAFRFRQARAELRDGRYQASVATCRLVLDTLALLQPMPTRKQWSNKAPETRSQEERWAAIHYDLWSLLSSAHHDDPLTRDFTWSRTDAEAILAAVGGLAARVMT